MRSDATDVEAYLDDLPDDRRHALSPVRQDGQTRLQQHWAATGRKLDMGKSCLRFRTLDDLALDIVGQAIARTSVDDLIDQHERAHR